MAIESTPGCVCQLERPHAAARLSARLGLSTFSETSLEGFGLPESPKQVQPDTARSHTGVAGFDKGWESIPSLTAALESQVTRLDSASRALGDALKAASSDLAEETAAKLCEISTDAMSGFADLWQELRENKRIVEQEKTALLAALSDARQEAARQANERLREFRSLASSLMEQTNALQDAAAALAATSSHQAAATAEESSRALAEVRSSLDSAIADSRNLMRNEHASLRGAIESTMSNELHNFSQSVDKRVDEKLRRVTASLVIISLSALGLFMLATLKM